MLWYDCFPRHPSYQSSDCAISYAAKYPDQDNWHHRLSRLTGCYPWFIIGWFLEEFEVYGEILSKPFTFPRLLNNSVSSYLCEHGNPVVIYELNSESSLLVSLSTFVFLLCIFRAGTCWVSWKLEVLSVIFWLRMSLNHVLTFLSISELKRICPNVIGSCSWNDYFLQLKF